MFFADMDEVSLLCGCRRAMSAELGFFSTLWMIERMAGVAVSWINVDHGDAAKESTCGLMCW
jgi:hypothetical protein